LAKAWFQAIAITPGSSRKSRRFIHSTRRHGAARILSGTWPLVRQMLPLHRSERPVSNLNLTHAEVLQVQHCQVRKHRASIARFETRARTAASRDRRAKPRLPRLPMCARPPLTGGGTNLNRHRKGRECEAHHTPKCFCVCRRPRPLQTNPAHNLRAPQEAVPRLRSEILGAPYRAAAGIAAGSRST